MRSIKILALCGALQLLSATAFGQSTIQSDSCICYTENQDRRCLECLINSSLKDSMIIELEKAGQGYQAAIQRYEQMDFLSRTIAEGYQEREIYFREEIIRLKRKNTVILIGSGIICGSLVGILFKK